MKISNVLIPAIMALSLVSCVSTPASTKLELPESAQSIDISDEVTMRILEVETKVESYRQYSAFGGNKLTVVRVVIDARVDPLQLSAMLSGITLFSYDKNQSQHGDAVLGMVDSNKFYTSKSEIVKGISYTPGRAFNLIFIDFTSVSIPVAIRTPYDERYLYGPETEEYQAAQEVMASVKNAEMFFRACAAGAYPLVVAMIDADKNIVNAKINNQPSALFYASAYGQAEVVRLLMQNGADPYFSWALNNSSGIVANCLMVAVYEGHEDVVHALVELGVDINAAVSAGWSALLVAAYTDNLELFQYLLDRGASLDQKVSYAWSGTSKDIVKILQERNSQKVMAYLNEKGLISP